MATVQKRLGWLGYSISASSQARQLYGDSTVKAVKAFQAKNWLSATGKVDKKTWRKLEKLAELKKSSFPDGMDYEINYDVSSFLDASIKQVLHTLG